MINQTSPAGVIIRQTVADVLGWYPSSILPFTELTPDNLQRVITILKTKGLKYPIRLEGIKHVNDLYQTQENWEEVPDEYRS